MSTAPHTHRHRAPDPTWLADADHLINRGIGRLARAATRNTPHTRHARPQPDTRPEPDPRQLTLFQRTEQE